MSDDDTKRRVSTDRRAVPPHLQAQLDALPGTPDTNGVPEAPAGNWAAVRRYYRPRKEAISLRVDADVLDWLRTRHERYQVEINRILRERMEADTA